MDPRLGKISRNNHGEQFAVVANIFRFSPEVRIIAAVSQRRNYGSIHRRPPAKAMQNSLRDHREGNWLIERPRIHCFSPATSTACKPRAALVRVSGLAISATHSEPAFSRGMRAAISQVPRPTEVTD